MLPTAPGPARQWRTLSTVRVALRTLELLARHPAGLRAEAVATALGESLSTAYRLLNTLCAEGFAERVPQNRTYRLGPKPRLLAGAAPPPAERARSLPSAELLAELTGRTHERSYFAVFDRGQMMVTDVQAPHHSPPIPGLGSTVRGEAHALAIGKLFLAHMEPDELHAYVDKNGLKAYTPRTITSVPALHQHLKRVRKVGLAFDREEYAEGFCCIAAPIMAGDGEVVAAVGISVPRDRFCALAGELTRRVRYVADTYAASLRALPAAPEHNPDERSATR